MEFRLFALEPPTNIQRAVQAIQEQLYSRWSLVSALALPPLIPLLFVHGASRISEGKQAEALRTALRGQAAPRAPRLATGSYILAGECLFWEVISGGPGGTLQELSGLCLRFLAGFSEAQRAREPPFPEQTGFLLALREQGVDLGQALSDLSPAPRLTFPVSALVLLRALSLPSIPAGAERPWWEALQWEEALRAPLKKPKRES